MAQLKPRLYRPHLFTSLLHAVRADKVRPELEYRSRARVSSVQGLTSVDSNAEHRDATPH
jgi:hypothetical protein